MERCYIGESFELRFYLGCRKDEDLSVNSATMTDYGPDGEAVTTDAAMSIGEDGHTASIRYTPSGVGMHRLVVTWRIGQDAWVQPNLLQVEDPTA